MKIVIDIPEEIYKDIQSRDWKNGELVFSDEWKAIHNGTPLPKGHGRLIDADELTKQLETVASDEWNKQVGASKGLEDAVDIVDDAQTIIEADNTESEE